MKLTAKQSDGSAVLFELIDITNIFPADDTIYVLGTPYRLSSVECKDASAAVAAEREACAKIAGDKSAWFSSEALASYGDDKITRMAQMDAADEIYRAIRDRQKP